MIFKSNEFDFTADNVNKIYIGNADNLENIVTNI